MLEDAAICVLADLSRLPELSAKNEVVMVSRDTTFGDELQHTLIAVLTTSAVEVASEDHTARTSPSVRPAQGQTALYSSKVSGLSSHDKMNVDDDQLASSLQAFESSSMQHMRLFLEVCLEVRRAVHRAQYVRVFFQLCEVADKQAPVLEQQQPITSPHESKLSTSRIRSNTPSNLKSLQLRKRLQDTVNEIRPDLLQAQDISMKSK
jgi:hypothetical protein